MADLAECLPDRATWEDTWHENVAFLKAKDAHDKAAEAEVRHWPSCWALHGRVHVAVTC